MTTEHGGATAADSEDEWYALLVRSRELLQIGDEEGFTRAALETYQARPHRGEPLYDLVQFYLRQSRGDLAAIYANAGQSLSMPVTDRLGVEPSIYQTGFKEAFTIAASYSDDPAERERGRLVCNWLALDRNVSIDVRELARRNYHQWYIEPACDLMASIEFVPVVLDAPEGYQPGNISIAREGGGFVALVRAVNYDLLESGYFDRHGDTSFRQRTILVRLDHNLVVTHSAEVLPPADLPPPQHTDSIGFEDPRPIFWRGDLWCVCSTRQLNTEGRSEMVLARITEETTGEYRLTDWRILRSAMPVRWEKNWMPQVVADQLRFVYALDPVRMLTEIGEVALEQTPHVAADSFRGGTQLVPLDGGWLMVIHEWQILKTRRHYFHRFVWLDADHRLKRLSRRFYFRRVASEFAAGLALHPDENRLVIAFGTDDHDPVLGIVDVADVLMTLMSVEEHRQISESAIEQGRQAWKALMPLQCPADTESMAHGTEDADRQRIAGTVSMFRDNGQTVRCATSKGSSEHRMDDVSAPPPARLFTAFGTVLYLDAETGRLRHGAMETSPTNVAFAPAQDYSTLDRMGRLVHLSRFGLEPILCLPEYCEASVPGSAQATSGTLLRVRPLERGLIGLEAEGLFLTAEPGGGIYLATTRCSTWELFLASESWCGNANEQIRDMNNTAFDRRRINEYIVHPIIRARTGACPSGVKVLIYGYPKWSHGRVYYDLCCHLHKRGYIVDILDWQQDHAHHIKDIIPYYDLFMCALDGIRTLVDIYGVPYDRIVAISHHELDIRMLVEQKGVDVFDKFAGYGVVSEFVYCSSIMQGVHRPPVVVPVGINYSEFFATPSDRLESVGYASSMSARTYGVEWKRGHLAEAAASEAHLDFKIAGSTGQQLSFHDMPDFYKTVDAVVTSSISEAAQLPVMEGAAAGRLIIGTPVGHFPVKAYLGGGILAPVEPEQFKKFTTATLKYYRDNPGAFNDKCNSIQETARQFDWKYAIGDWIGLLEAAGTKHASTAHGRKVRPIEVLTDSAKYDFSADWFSRHVDTWNDLLTQLRPTRILEIGSFEGRSTCHLIEQCAKLTPLEICCIDTWEGGIEHDKRAMPDVERRFDQNIALACSRASHRVAVRKLKKTSTLALAELLSARERPFDFIYVDGSHQAPDVLADAVMAFHLLRVGGIMIFDDYLWHIGPDGAQDPFNMPKPAIDSFINAFQRKLRILSGLPINQLFVEKQFE